MDIQGKKFLILGGWGLVGSAIVREALAHNPKEIIIHSLQKNEAEKTVNEYQANTSETKLTPEWGNIFVRAYLKDKYREDVLNNPKYRQQLLFDMMEPLNDEILNESNLFQIINRHRPDIIVDTVNTATALAYQDIYFEYHRLKKYIGGKEKMTYDDLLAELEKLMDTLYIPQFIRHIQILHKSMLKSKTKMYLKIGTTGTGGMGLNIPYTHSEEKPSRVLLSKSALAGAHSMLLFLMGRTPGGPIIKEIKPGAAIAWKSIQYGDIKKKGKTIPLFDCLPENAETLGAEFQLSGSENWENMNGHLKSVFIDTGENGIFSLGEFEAITTAGQMEFVTPEEISHNAVMEILGSSTGTDIINAMDNTIMGPTYRAGYMRDNAIRKMIALCAENKSESIAFEILGPPRLSKLLHEAHLIKKVAGTLKNLAGFSSDNLKKQTEKIVLENKEIRSQAISIGIPILLSDGKRILRGPNVVAPKNFGRDSLPITPKNIEEWADAGWIDLRKKNIEKWIYRANQILQKLKTVSPDDTSSRFHHGHVYWSVEQPIAIGKLAAWIFINEDKGQREKR